MVTVGKTFTFEAAHFIEGHSTCGKIHGHSWVLTVMLRDEPDITGMVVDFKQLGGVVRDILKYIDHKCINEVVNFKPITAETLVTFLCANIKTHLKSVLDYTPRELGCRLQEGIDGGWAEHWLAE